MRIQTVASIAGGVATAVVGLPALLVARRLRYEVFSPAKDRKGGSLDLQITAVSDQTVTLRRAAKSPSINPDEPGQYLLHGARGWGYAGRVIDSNEILAIREFRPGDGDVRAGDYGRLDSFALPIDPFRAHGVPFGEVTVASPVGDFPAWYIPGKSHTWAIMTHGKGADRRESLRLLPVLVESGFHCLAITYRNDEGLPPAPDGHYSFGRDEWEDLDGAVAYALAHGAEDILLVGYSMGGAITLSFMANSDHAGDVSAIILDAPMTDLREVVVHGARDWPMPLWFLHAARRAAAFIYRFKWSDFDYLRTLPGLSAPVLLFHGDADPLIPVELSDSVAAARPDLVRYVRVPRAGHVRSWNVDPLAYEETVRDFIHTQRSVRANQ